MTRLNLQLNGPDKAINFAQGFPDFATDSRIVESAAKAMRDGYQPVRHYMGRAAAAKRNSAQAVNGVGPRG